MITVALSLIGYLGLLGSIFLLISGLASQPLNIQAGISGIIGSVILLAFVRVLELLESINEKLDLPIKAVNNPTFPSPNNSQTGSATTYQMKFPSIYGVQKEFVKNYKGLPIYKATGTRTFYLGDKEFDGM